jgi:hypothetical protein
MRRSLALGDGDLCQPCQDVPLLPVRWPQGRPYSQDGDRRIHAAKEQAEDPGRPGGMTGKEHSCR